MNNEAKIEGTAEAWEDRQLGCDENFARPANVDENAIDEALDLQMISIRLQKGLLESLKAIASLNGIGYQPLIKQVLHRFVDAELRMIAVQYANEKRAETNSASEEDELPPPERRCASR